MSTGANNAMRSIQKIVEAYPDFEIYENSAEEIHKLTKENYNIIKKLREEIVANLPKDYFFKMVNKPEEAFALKNRILPFQYQIPKKVMNNNLADISTQLTENQSKILELIDTDSFKQIVSDSFLIKVDELPRLFKKTNIVESFALLSALQSQIKVLEYRIIEEFSVTVTNLSFGTTREFVPIVHANTSNLKIGDTYEAEVFAASYRNGNNIKAYADGKEIPVENGIALYTVKPTSIGKKKVTITMVVTNPLTKKNSTYENDFEYDVVDCD